MNDDVTKKLTELIVERFTVGPFAEREGGATYRTLLNADEVRAHEDVGRLLETSPEHERDAIFPSGYASAEKQLNISAATTRYAGANRPSVVSRQGTTR